MTPLRLSLLPTLLFAAAESQIIAAQDAQTKPSSTGTAIRNEFRYQPVFHVTEEPAPFFLMATPTSDVEIVRLPNYVVRDLPDRTKRDLDTALAQRQKLSSGAAVEKNLGKRVRFEAVLPIWLDQNVKGDRIFRFDVL